jgi:uncharacterized protein (TIGR00299 family) protein
MIPIPAPATAELLKGIPSYSTDIEGELTTPTGALLIKTLCEEFIPMPDMKIETIGYGAGYYDLPIPNLLRIQIGEPAEQLQDKYDSDTIVMLETNIDDQSPEMTAFACERLFEAGALDVYTTPVYMKKGRTGIILTVLCPHDKQEILTDEVFRHTNTFGIRISMVKRIKLKREIIKTETKYGTIHIKKGFSNNGSAVMSPEFEICREAAVKHNVPIMEVYREALRAAGV